MRATNTANAGWTFYKYYYQPDVSGGGMGRKIDYLAANDNTANESIFQIRNKLLTELVIPAGQENCLIPKSQQFNLFTNYPGLLIGSGYNHGTNKKGEIKLGFLFDHTTGLPYIPGSSVKGLLRSVFPGKDKERMEAAKQKMEKEKKEKEKEEKEKLVQIYKSYYEDNLSYLQSILKALNIKLTDTQIIQLEYEMFEGITDVKKKELSKIQNIKSNRKIPISKRDVFHDAIIVGPVEQPFLGTDFITPHREPLKNPIPISFIKVLPYIQFCFQFKLSESKLNDVVISASQKEQLFRKIILTIGAGAKTNVGYGQFVEQENRVKTTELKSSGGIKQANQQGGGRQQGNRNQPIKPIQSGPGLQTKLDTNLAIPENLQAQITKASYGKIIRGDEVYGQIVKSDRKFYYVKVLVEENNELITNVQQSKKWKKLPVGMVLLLKVTSVTNKDKIDCSINKKIIE